jgi:putative nucleotide binding protein
MKKDAIVLDNIKKNFQFKQANVIQCIGTSNFSLLELISNESAKINDIVSTEEGVVRRITYDKLTLTAKNGLEKAVETIVESNQERFVNFFNTAKPIGIRRHQLDLLPMIGKKHRDEILKYLGNNGKFTSFDDIKKIGMMPDPIKIVITRIIDEIKDGPENKYFLFTMPYFKRIN